MIFNPSYRSGIRERMGWVPRTRSDQPVVWIHGVSVGEVKAAGTLIARLRQEYPHLQLVISSTTPTGHSLAQRQHQDLQVIYYPLDFGASYGSGVFPGPGGVNYQYWYRDPQGGPTGFNLSDGLHVQHTP